MSVMMVFTLPALAIVFIACAAFEVVLIRDEILLARERSNPPSADSPG